MNPNPTVVLVADDDPATRLYISRELAKQGHHVLTATNGKEALEQIQTHDLDMVLLDIIMPETDGYQVLQYLKADAGLRSIPVIMISAAGDVDRVVRCIELGAEDCLIKPLNSVLLKTRINTYLERKRLRDQEQAYLHQLQIEKSEAEVAHRAKSAFIANMSHELRTPLNAIIGYSEILHEELQAEDMTDLVSDLDRILQSGKHLLGLIDGILDLAKIESGKMELYLENFDIKTLISKIFEAVKPLAEINQNTLRLHCDDTIGMMYADLNKVRQILWNLLDNAVKFTQNGTILLTVERELIPPASAWITFRISDTGIGISPEQQQHIFGLFTQADESSTRQYGGAGLGLTLTRRFCQLLGGFISVESQVDRGSTFTVHLPADANPYSENSEIRGNEEPFIQTPNAKLQTLTLQTARATDLILVVDDDRTVRDRMVQTFNQAGYRVVTSWQAAEGLRLARELLPGLIVLDMQLPEMDSWTVLLTLKEDAALAKIPVILQALPAQFEIEPPETRGFLLGLCDRLTTADDFKRLTVQLQPFRTATTNPLQPGRVLLVQNDPTTQQILQRLLTKSGWEVSVAQTYETATAHLHNANVIVLDLLLPDSFQLLTDIQQSELNQSVPVVAILTEVPTLADRRYLHQNLNILLQQPNPCPILKQLHNTVCRYFPPDRAQPL